jgi:hypothetical protein
VTWQAFVAAVILAGLLPFYAYILAKVISLGWFSGRATYFAAHRSRCAKKRNFDINEEPEP